MRGVYIFEKPCYREIRVMRGRAMRGLPVLSFCGNQFAYCSTISNRICLKITVLYSTPYHEITMTPITYLCKQTADFKKCSIESKYYNELTSPQTIGSTQYSLTK